MIGFFPRPRLLARFALPAALALTALASARDLAAQRRRVSGFGYSSRIDTTFAFDKNGSVTINAGNGDVIVSGWSRDQIHVRATSDDDNLRIDGSSSRVTLQVAGNRRGSDTRFEVSVPYGVRVSAQSQSGDVSVHGTRGQVEIRVQSGDIQVEDVTTRLDISSLSGDISAAAIRGDVSISTVNGQIRLNDVQGNIDVGTVSADIRLLGVTAKSVRAKTTSGDVTYDGTIDPAGRYELTAHSGDINVHIPRDASAELTVSTWNGGVDSDFPITLKPGDHTIGVKTAKRYTFEIGGGAARITAETFSGDIKISSNGRGATERRNPQH